MYEVMGGNLDSLYFYDGGPHSHLEDCCSLEEAKTALAEWHRQNYAAWIVDKETGTIIFPPL